MPLIIQKQPYSSLPWRLVMVRGDDAQVVPDSGFARLRDAVPVHAQLLTIGNWDQFSDWTPAQHTAVQRLLDAAPMRTHLRALRQQGSSFGT